MNNIYDILPLNFFNVFIKNKIVMSDCLFILYDYLKEDTEFTSLKENIIFELTKYFNTHIVEMDDVESKQPKDKAYQVYRRFKECGWLSEEQRDNYQIYTSFEDYAIVIIEVLKNLDKENDVEYSSIVYSIYKSFINFDVNNGHKIFESEYNRTKELMTKLKNLNTNIKRYIKKLLKDNMKNNLNDVLEALLSDYQVKVIDRAFYNLTTKDNPVKYRNNIILQIKKIRDDESSCDIIIRNIMETKDIDYFEATALFDQQSTYILDAFEGIMDLINEISRKNERFVATAINRIMFLINVKEDISGKINEIIKFGQENSSIFDDMVTLSVNKYLDQDSLYTPRQVKRAVESEVLIEPHLDENVRKMALEKMKTNKKYTRLAIEKNILERLKDSQEIYGSQYLEEEHDLSLFVLTWLYGYSVNSKYKIEPLDQIVIKDNYKFREFVIKGAK